MNTIIAKSKYLRGTAQKARRVADVVRGMNADYALDLLKYMPHRAAALIYKTLRSAVANAENNNGLDRKNLVIQKLLINDAPMFKRGRAESKGRYRQILKRNSHVEIHLAEKEVTAKAPKVETKETKVSKPKSPKKK